MRIPEERLVYLYCSSIFTGTNAEVRKLKKVTQILLKHEASIRGFIDEFGLENVSVVAKKLLKERVFESPDRAQRRFPDLLQRSEAGKVGGTLPDGSLRTITPEELSPHSRSSSAEQRQVILPSSFSRRDHLAQLIHHSDPNAIIHEPSLNLLWRLHPIHLPFRTQHRILTFVQSTLEECCQDFGQTWAPHLMKAHNWDEAESIELTEWIKIFSKCIKDLPPSATRPITGKSPNQVLFDTAPLRHTAVHRLQTDVEGVMGMLQAARDFSLALKDTARAALIRKIEEQLAAGINILFQGQGLLQRKVSGELEVTAKGRSELNKLEQLWAINLKGHKRVQRTETASAIKDVVTNPQNDSSLRSLNHRGRNKSTVFEQATPEDRNLKTGRVASLVRLFERRGES